MNWKREKNKHTHTIFAPLNIDLPVRCQHVYSAIRCVSIRQLYSIVHDLHLAGLAVCCAPSPNAVHWTKPKPRRHRWHVICTNECHPVNAIRCIDFLRNHIMKKRRKKEKERKKNKNIIILLDIHKMRKTWWILFLLFFFCFTKFAHANRSIRRCRCFTSSTVFFVWFWWRFIGKLDISSNRKRISPVDANARRWNYFTRKIQN